MTVVCSACDLPANGIHKFCGFCGNAFVPMEKAPKQLGASSTVGKDNHIVEPTRSTSGLIEHESKPKREFTYAHKAGIFLLAPVLLFAAVFENWSSKPPSHPVTSVPTAVVEFQKRDDAKVASSLVAQGLTVRAPIPGTYTLLDKLLQGKLSVAVTGGLVDFTIKTSLDEHECSLSGTGKAVDSNVTYGPDLEQCKVELQFSDDGTQISVQLNSENCRSYCGMKAGMDGKYISLK